MPINTFHFCPRSDQLTPFTPLLLSDRNLSDLKRPLMANGLNGFPTREADIFSRASTDALIPIFDAATLALTSGGLGRPRKAAANFSLVSAERGGLRFTASDTLRRVSSV